MLYLFLAIVKNKYDDRPTALKIIHITIIWYRAAVNGDIPDKICPVIIPGRETRPTAKREFITGIKDALKAILFASLYLIPLFISACILSDARLTPFIELENIIPANGMIKRGVYQGSNCNINWVTIKT